jgi:hypothetical protein
VPEIPGGSLVGSLSDTCYKHTESTRDSIVDLPLESYL